MANLYNKAVTQRNLPILSETPQHHADCCLSLSTTLIHNLSDLFTTIHKSGPVLSIGSGTGLLEALVNIRLTETRNVSVQIEGVEVRSSSSSSSSSGVEMPMNAYLPEELTTTVDGTWAVCSRINVATGLIFVYPRAVGLVERYLELCALSQSNVVAVVWLGPKVDWADYVDRFVIEGFESVEVVEGYGLVQYEMMAVLRRKFW